MIESCIIENARKLDDLITKNPYILKALPNSYYPRTQSKEDLYFTLSIIAYKFKIPLKNIKERKIKYIQKYNKNYNNAGIHFCLQRFYNLLQIPFYCKCQILNKKFFKKFSIYKKLRETGIGVMKRKILLEYIENSIKEKGFFIWKYKDIAYLLSVNKYNLKKAFRILGKILLKSGYIIAEQKGRNGFILIASKDYIYKNNIKLYNEIDTIRKHFIIRLKLKSKIQNAIEIINEVGFNVKATFRDIDKTTYVYLSRIHKYLKNKSINFENLKNNLVVNQLLLNFKIKKISNFTIPKKGIFNTEGLHKIKFQNKTFYFYYKPKFIRKKYNILSVPVFNGNNYKGKIWIETDNFLKTFHFARKFIKGIEIDIENNQITLILNFSLYLFFLYIYKLIFYKSKIR